MQLEIVVRRNAVKIRRPHVRVKSLAATLTLVNTTIVLSGVGAAWAAPAEEPEERVADAIDQALAEVGMPQSISLSTAADGSVRSEGIVETALPSAGGPLAVRSPAGAFELGLPLPADVESLELVDGDTALYRDAQSEYDVAIQATALGARALVHIASPDAPYTYRFELDLGPDESARRTSDGGVEIRAERDGVSAVLASIAPPWALDAKGAAVPTWYEVDGSTVVQHVDHARAVYPVVADPSLSFGWKIYVTFSRSEASAIGGLPVQYAKYLAPVCIAVPNGAVAASCGLYLYDVLNSVANTFKTARSRSCEVEMQYLYGTSTLVGWKTKNCRR